MSSLVIRYFKQNIDNIILVAILFITLLVVFAMLNVDFTPLIRKSLKKVVTIEPLQNNNDSKPKSFHNRLTSSFCNKSNSPSQQEEKCEKLNENSSLEVKPTKPIFSQNASELASIANNLSISELQNLMGISENLAKLNANRFTSFGKQKTMPAALAFAGDTYQGLNAHTFNKNDIEWAQDHLRIISGLYGLLRPLDKIEPYRLEMGSKLKTPSGNNLYDYWDKTISLAINKHSEDTNSKALVISCSFLGQSMIIDPPPPEPVIFAPNAPFDLANHTIFSSSTFDTPIELSKP